MNAPNNTINTERERRFSSCAAVVALLSLVIAGCDTPTSRSAHSDPMSGAKDPAAAQPTTPSTASVKPAQSVSAAAAELYLGLLTAIDLNPEQNAVSTYAAAFHWAKAPPEMNALENAKEGYFGKIGDKPFLLASDGTNDVFGIAVKSEFDAKEFESQLRQVFTLTPLDSESSLGQTSEMFRLSEGSKDLGVLMVMYGTVDLVRGAGSISYVSPAKFRQVGGHAVKQGASPAAGIVAGQLEDGLAAYRRGDYQTAFRLIRPLADQGYAAAKNSLGFMYQSGQGVAQDYAEALKWYRKAAEQGNADAQYNLAFMYHSGQGVRQDDAEAVKRYRKAAEQGHAAAQFNLALMYAKGLGVAKDYAGALKWYRKAAEQGNADAQYNLAFMYENGRGVPQDYGEAMKWYRKAADQGHAAAENGLGFMYDNGHGLAQDYAEAAKWYRKAAEQGDAKAQFNLATMYVTGQGVPRDYVRAHMWFNLVAQTGNELAVKNRDLLAAHMTPAQNAEAQKLAREWRPKIPTRAC